MPNPVLSVLGLLVSCPRGQERVPSPLSSALLSGHRLSRLKATNTRLLRSYHLPGLGSCLGHRPGSGEPSPAKDPLSSPLGFSPVWRGPGLPERGCPPGGGRRGHPVENSSGRLSLRPWPALPAPPSHRAGRPQGWSCGQWAGGWHSLGRPGGPSASGSGASPLSHQVPEPQEAPECPL